MCKPPAVPQRGFKPLTIIANVLNSLHLFSEDTRLHRNVFCYLAMFYSNNRGENERVTSLPQNMEKFFLRQQKRFLCRDLWTKRDILMCRSAGFGNVEQEGKHKCQLFFLFLCNLYFLQFWLESLSLARSKYLFLAGWKWVLPPEALQIES